MRTYGYIIRVATKEQDEDRQRIGMWSFGVAEDNVVLIDPLNVFQDALVQRRKIPIVHNALHQVGDGCVQCVRVLHAQAHLKAPLGICVQHNNTFFPCCASPTPKLAAVVVLPTPPF